MKSKLIPLIITLFLLLAACEFTPTPNPSTGSGQAPEEEPAPSPTPVLSDVEGETFKPEPEPAQADTVPEAQEPTPEPTATFTPTFEEKINCVELLTPLDLADLSPEGKVVFTWTAHPDANSYSLNFIFPDGLELSFPSDETTKNRYMDGFSMHPAYNQSGEHQWNVSALNTAGEQLCQSAFFTFTKPATGSAPRDNGNGGGGGEKHSCEPWPECGDDVGED